MDHPFLVGMLYGRADIPEKLQALAGIKLPLIAEVGDGNALDQLHGEVGPPAGGDTSFEHPRNIRVAHHGECLAFRFKTGQHLLGVHARLDHLQRNHAPHRFHLLGHPDHSESSFSDLLAQDEVAHPLALHFGVGCLELTGEHRRALGIAEKLISLHGVGQHAPDLRFQLRLPGAGFGKESLAGTTLKIDSADEDFATVGLSVIHVDIRTCVSA